MQYIKWGCTVAKYNCRKLQGSSLIIILQNILINLIIQLYTYLIWSVGDRTFSTYDFSDSDTNSHAVGDTISVLIMK